MTPEEHYESGMNEFSEDRLDEAIVEFRKAIEMDPNYADALHAMAMCHFHKRSYDDAIEWGHRYREAEPDSPLAYTSLSMFYHAKGMVPEAEDMGAKAQQASLKQR